VGDCSLAALHRRGPRRKRRVDTLHQARSTEDMSTKQRV